jgi:pimeloyl-ACP methyl ester carboxylesterase
MNAFEFPSEFRTKDIATNGTTIHVRSGGRGPAVVLLHGYGETAICGRSWRPSLHAIIPSSYLTSAGWVFPLSLPEASTRKRKPAISPACSTR